MEVWNVLSQLSTAAGVPGGMSLGGEVGMVLLEALGSHPVKGDGRDRAGLRQTAWAGARSEKQGLKKCVFAPLVKVGARLRVRRSEQEGFLKKQVTLLWEKWTF